MKKQLHLFTAALLFAVGTANAQTGIGTVAPDLSAQLEVASTEKGFLPPRMNGAQRDAIAGPATGLMLFNLTANCLQVNTGTPAVPKWDCISGNGVGMIASLTGKVWMDRNLGASQVATSATDHLAYGSLYQWGRGNDGHQLINWSSGTGGTPVNGISPTLSTSDTPGHSDFITSGTTPQDWRDAQNDNLWQGISGINNPCPAGFRLPTEAEFTAEVTAYNITDAASAYASPLKFVLAGTRYYHNASLGGQGNSGRYWTSTPGSTLARYRNFSSTGTSASSDYRAHGNSVRCLQD